VVSPYRAARAQVWKRCDGRCEVCGHHFAIIDEMSAHHRRARSHGRDDSVGNLLSVCIPCHQRAHEHPALARENGWIVSGFDQRAAWEVPVRIRTGWVTLANDGAVLPTVLRVSCDAGWNA
jgi:HNH endonuclease